MSEELLQRGLINNPEKIGKWDFYNISSTTVNALKNYGIISNINYPGVEKKKVDGIIVQNKKVIAVVEYKTPAEFKTKKAKNKAIKQEIEVAKKLGTKLLIATDTKESIWVNVLTNKSIVDEDGNELKYNFDPKNEKTANLIEKVVNSINENNNKIKPKQLVNPTELAKQIWQDIWSVSGATPENCLYTFVELFIFKYLSDLGVLSQGINFDHLIERFDYKIENPNEEALEFYAGTIRPKIKELFPASNDGTTIINGTIFVSKAQKAVKGYSTVFKRVLYRFRDYGKLENIDYDFKSQLFESFLKESISKKNWGQFFTPLKIVRAIVEMAKDEIKEGIKICDPACGVGKFLLEPIAAKMESLFTVSKTKVSPKIVMRGFDKGFDNDEQKTIILAKANMLIYFSDLIKENPTLTKEFAKLFNESFILKTNSILGTLSDPVEDEYDLILTNPPYVTSGSSNLKEEIKKDGDLINYFKINAMGVEGLFLEWIIRALKPNGKAYVIVPDGIMNRQNDRNLRQFILDECIIDAIISLPLKTFFNTNKKTYILCLTKKNIKSLIQKDPVLTYFVSEIGESRDIYRFEIEKNDLVEAVTLYSFFKGNKKVFEKINSDKRCKIQPISRFNPDLNWSVDRWWTKEEKIELGIEDEETLMSTSEFGSLVNDVSQSLFEYSAFLKDISEKKNKKLNKIQISLSDEKYFKLFIGKRLLKKDLRQIEGDLPVYSANVKEPIAYQLDSNIKDFSNHFILWGIDGDFEFNVIHKNNKFVTTDHCGAIRILSDNIIPEYLLFELEKNKHKYGFDRGLRASLKNMAQITVEIPCNEKNEFDIEEQRRFAEMYMKIDEIKVEILGELNKLEKQSIEYI